MHNVINLILTVLVLLIWIFVVFRVALKKFVPVKTVSAKVCDKYVKNSVPNHYGTFSRENYIVVFKTENNKLSFCVSKYSYDNYRIDENNHSFYYITL